MNNFCNFVASDMLQAKIIQKDKKVKCLYLLLKFLLSRTIRIIILLRLSQVSTKVISSMAKLFLRHRFIEIGDIQMGKGFFLPHPQCIIIASGVKIGEHVHVGQYVTIGGNLKKTKVLENGEVQKLPIIGNRVMIHPGAVIGGPVTIGDDVIIGANSVVTKDVPSNTIVYGQNQFADKKITVPSEGGSFNKKEL